MKFLVFILAIALVLLVTYLSRKPRLVEKLTRLATDADRKEAMRAFLKKKCLAANHQWNESADGATWDCHYSEGTCKANSYWPEVSSDDDPHGIARMYQYWNQADEKCYVGYGAFRKKCEELGLNWIEDSQTCRVTPQYCKDKLLSYKDGDCYDDPITTINEKVFGKTLGRAMSMAGIGGFIRAANWSENNVL